MRGIVKEFRSEAGFGKLTLADGSEMSFDVAASNKRDIAVGEAAEVTIGRGLRGQPKVTLVEFPLAEDRVVAAGAFLASAHASGLLLEWTARDLRSAAKALDLDASAIDGAAAGALLEAYYDHGATERATRDRVLVVDWRHGQDVEHVAEVMAGLAAISDVVVLERLDGAVIVRDGDRTESIDLTGTLQALADFFDDALERRARPERFRTLPTDGDFEIFVLRDREPALLP